MAWSANAHVAADIENHVGLLYEADYTICLLKDL
jgi:hypothetical protein